MYVDMMRRRKLTLRKVFLERVSQTLINQKIYRKRILHFNLKLIDNMLKCISKVLKN